MSNGRSPSRRRDPNRDGDTFIALPDVVLASEAYIKLSHPAKSLLIELARQCRGHNNGQLLASMNYLRERGWNSSDVVTRAKRELLDGGFIFETVKGCRPNKASWFAITWRSLDPSPRYDAGAAAAFTRSAYCRQSKMNNVKSIPSRGAAVTAIAPSPGVGAVSAEPSDGAVGADLRPSPTPSPGHHLEMPSPSPSGPRQAVDASWADLSQARPVNAGDFH